MFLFTIVYGAAAVLIVTGRKNYRRGVEHGSARWGNVVQAGKRYRDHEHPFRNLILTQHFQMGLDGHRHKRNTNVLVIGGSGAGKSRSYAIPNVLQCAQGPDGGCSILVSDPKAELLRKTGNALIAAGYEVRVFDLLSPDTSFCYNPLAYVRDDKDVLRLIETLIQSTTPPGSQSTDPFWTKSETALLQALVLYLIHEAPKDEQNFAMVMEMLAAAEVREEDEDFESPLDILFERLEMRDPESIAVKQYHIFKMGAGKTLKSILIDHPHAVWRPPTPSPEAFPAEAVRGIPPPAGGVCAFCWLHTHGKRGRRSRSPRPAHPAPPAAAFDVPVSAD